MKSDALPTILLCLLCGGAYLGLGVLYFCPPALAAFRQDKPETSHAAVSASLAQGLNIMAMKAQYDQASPGMKEMFASMILFETERDGTAFLTPDLRQFVDKLRHDRHRSDSPH